MTGQLGNLTYLTRYRPDGPGMADSRQLSGPRIEGYVDALAYLLIASFSVALRRAWSLLQGRHLPAS